MAPKSAYSKDQMNRAIQEVNNGEKVSVAATKYGVPRITLRNKVKGISPLDCTLGPATVLSQEEETLLVKWVLYMAECHYPVTKDHLMDSVQKIIVDKNLKTPFTNNRPGKKWFSSFLKRHPELAQRTAQNLSKAREAVTQEDLSKWFETIEKYLLGKGLSEALKDPTRIYNTDESAFYLQPNAGKVLVRRGEKNVYSSSGDEKENLTVLITANAAGIMAPPMIVYPYERIPTIIARSIPSGWGNGRSETGWMCARTFYEFMTNVFNPWLIKKKIKKPVIFFLDGHASHMSLHLAYFCRDNGIELIALFPNSTHLIQPMDVAVFRPLKSSWRVQVMNWKTENQGARLKKEDFAPNLQEALKSISSETIKNGFRKSGLYPFGTEYVDMSKIPSGNRTVKTNNDQRQTEYVLEKTKFLKFLEKEIQEVFSSNKLSLFNKLYYMPRSEVDNLLSDEDQNLYVIWAKTKSVLTETTNISNNNYVTCQLQQPYANEESDLPSSENSKDLPENTYLTQASTDQCQLSPQTTEKESEQPNSTLSKRAPISDIGSNEIETTTGPVGTSTFETVGENYDPPSSHEQASTSTQCQYSYELEPGQSTSSLTDVVIPTAMENVCTPVKINLASKPSTSTSTPIGYVPSPFKRVLFWPEPETKKRRIKERLPSAISSDLYIQYIEKKEHEKKQKIEEKEKRALERKEKQLLKEKIRQEKEINKAGNKGKGKTKTTKSKKKQISSSSSEELNTDVEYQESEYDLEEDLYKSESEEDLPLETLALLQKKDQKGRYVIIKYEEEYFPGIIKNIDGKQYEISTMVLSKGNIFRWPDIIDQIWYDEKSIIEYIKEPVPINNRGFYKIEEMKKFLPYIL